MRSLAIGSVVAAVVMFALGFVFFGLLFPIALSPLGTDAAAAAQAALASNLPGSGSYMVPMDEAAFMAGPAALVNFIAAGDVPSMPVAMGLGFLHFLVSAFLLGMVLRAVGGDFAHQAKVVLLLGLTASVFMHLGDGIWYGYGWRMPLFEFAADGIMLIAGGLVLARWFTSARSEPSVAAPAEALPAE